MSVYIDRKYLLLISSRLRNFKQKKEDLFNFSCPYCGDSQKNKLKARGYVFRKNNDYYYMCHNCSTSTTFSKFLKHIDGEFQRQYVFERYADGEGGHSNYEKPKFNLAGPKPSGVFSEAGNTIRLSIGTIEDVIPKDAKYSLASIEKLPEEHFARKYIEGRKIPHQRWLEIFYTDKFKEFLDGCFPDHGNQDVPNDQRIVLFYTNERGEITNVSGRALGETNIRYCTVKVSEDKKLFGMHRMQSDSRIYVLEGQFDSFFISNSIASGDSNLGGVAEYLKNSDCVLVYDNEPRNKEIVKQISRSIDKGYTVSLFPDTIPHKDVNEMIINGMGADEIKNIIDQNTFQGLTAKLKFIDWRKC